MTTKTTTADKLNAQQARAVRNYLRYLNGEPRKFTGVADAATLALKLKEGKTTDEREDARAALASLKRRDTEPALKAAFIENAQAYADINAMTTQDFRDAGVTDEDVLSQALGDLYEAPAEVGKDDAED